PRAGAAPVPGYGRIKQILDDAVQGQNIGKHGPFWRALTRDQFVSFSVFGRKVIASRPDGAFDPDESNLVKALEGRAPFGADRTPPPPGRSSIGCLTASRRCRRTGLTKSGPGSQPGA